MNNTDPLATILTGLDSEGRKQAVTALGVCDHSPRVTKGPHSQTPFSVASGCQDLPYSLPLTGIGSDWKLEGETLV